VFESDVLKQFEGLILHLLKKFGKPVNNSFPKLTYKDAVENYGTDKPDLRFDIKINEITDTVKGKNFNIFDNSEYTGCLVLPEKAELSRKEIDNLTEWVKRPQVGANGILWIKNNDDDAIKSSFDKFFTSDDLKNLIKNIGSKSGDLILIMSGKRKETLEHLGTLRLEIGKRYDFINHDVFCPAWITDFPLFEYDDEEKKFKSTHHPFTSPNKESLDLLNSNPENVIANAYDLVLNGNEIGGGSIRIHDYNIQMKIFEILGMSKKEYESQFGFLIEALKYGAPPHGGIAFGLDRLAAVLNNKDVIRDFIAFPKNNSGRDVMLDAPSKIDSNQLNELGLKIK
jgi:aspartyl-tRNA synthetase